MPLCNLLSSLQTPKAAPWTAQALIWTPSRWKPSHLRVAAAAGCRSSLSALAKGCFRAFPLSTDSPLGEPWPDSNYWQELVSVRPNVRSNRRPLGVDDHPLRVRRRSPFQCVSKTPWSSQKKILTVKLKMLLELGVFDIQPASYGTAHKEYALTEGAPCFLSSSACTSGGALLVEQGRELFAVSEQ